MEAHGSDNCCEIQKWHHAPVTIQQICQFYTALSRNEVHLDAIYTQTHTHTYTYKARVRCLQAETHVLFMRGLRKLRSDSRLERRIPVILSMRHTPWYTIQTLEHRFKLQKKVYAKMCHPR